MSIRQKKVIIFDISVPLTSEMIENHDVLFVSNIDHNSPTIKQNSM